MKIFLIYIKSLLDFILLLISRNNISENKNETNNLLFINTGQIGDLVISAALLEEDERFDGYSNVFFLIQKQFEELYKDYKGRIKIIIIDLDAYKYNIIYRFKFNNYLRKLNIDIVYNLTSIRPTWNDALALGIGAKKTFCYPNNWLTLKKVFPETTDALYTKQIATEFFNEYDKLNCVLGFFQKQDKKIGEKKTVFYVKKIKEQYDVIIAPFSTAKSKEWGIDKFSELTQQLSKSGKKVLLIGSISQKDGLQLIKGECQNVSIAAETIPLNELISYLNAANLYIGLDSGISHLSLKANKKRIILVGGGTYGMYFPKPTDIETIYLTNKLPCFQCGWECRFEQNFCLSDIKVNVLLSYINKALSNENS